jgi:hypothetical protein
LPDAGVVLVPPSSPEYAALLSGIARRPESIPRELRDTSAILVNRSSKAIAAIRIIWRPEEIGGRLPSSTYQFVFGRKLLLPFDVPEETLKRDGYWNVILPGSKRYLDLGRRFVGNNKDVRPPASDEQWKGTIVSFGPSDPPSRPLNSLTVALDGVFFSDGEFAGPNWGMLFEQIAGEAESRLRIAALVRRHREKGAALAEVFAEIETVTGPIGPGLPPPPPPPPPSEQYPDDSHVRTHTLKMIGHRIGLLWQHLGDEVALARILAWEQVKLPEFRRR